MTTSPFSQLMFKGWGHHLWVFLVSAPACSCRRLCLASSAGISVLCTGRRSVFVRRLAYRMSGFPPPTLNLAVRRSCFGGAVKFDILSLGVRRGSDHGVANRPISMEVARPR